MRLGGLVDLRDMGAEGRVRRKKNTVEHFEISTDPVFVLSDDGQMPRK
jgi:hypothetical protein